ncbi:MAG: sensor histidine kinase, partial [Methanobacteriota archaeon]
NQIAYSYSSSQSVRTIVDAKGIGLDINRATPIGLIVNEIVTNSFKHAFPPEFMICRTECEDPCTVGVSLTREDGSFLMKVYDNGIGIPEGFDPLTTRSLGLKLVNFLAKHQLRAAIEINRKKGTEFVFRFNELDYFG